MIIDIETFTEVVVHLRLASEKVLEGARHLTVLAKAESGNDNEWDMVLQAFMGVNTEIDVIERLMRALMVANSPDRELE